MGHKLKKQLFYFCFIYLLKYKLFSTNNSILIIMFKNYKLIYNISRG